MELRSGTDVTTWLATGLLLRRVGDDDAVARDAITACSAELSALPPPGVIADLAQLVMGTRLPSRSASPGDDAMRGAIRAYDDDLLARLVTTPRFDDVVAAFAHLAASDRPAAIALIVGSIVERAGFSGAAISPAALRRALGRPRDEREAIGHGELRGDRDEVIDLRRSSSGRRLVHGAVAAQLAGAYLRLARGARHSRALVDDRDVFALDHFAMLRDLGARMTAAHLAGAAEAIGRSLPRRITARREDRGSRETHLADDTLYPAGGFSSITPGGASANLDNLVTSELVYMDDGDEPDVFTIRYVEGELLYYTRDDSVLRRHRHVIAFALGPDLDDARVKDPDVPWQRVIVALGLVVAAVRWLDDQLGDQALAIRIAFPPGLLGEERGLVALLLAAEIERGVVTIVEEGLAATIDVVRDAGTGAFADLVVVSLAADVPLLPRELRARHVHPGRPELWLDWCDAAEGLVRWLV